MSNKVPQLRFNGYSDAWVQRKLSDVMTFLNGRAYKQPELLDSGKYPVLRVGNFGTNEQWYYSDLELDEKFYANDGDLLYTWATAFGPHIWRGDKVIYHYHIWKLDLSEAIHRDFAVQVLEYGKAKLLANTNGSTMIHVTKGEMEKKEIAIPSTEEQDKIGDLFNKLDSLIALHQRKLDLLKEQKKGYLQKMFPKKGAKVPELRFAGFADDWEERKLGDITKISTGKLDANAMVENGKYDFYTSGIKKYRIDVAAFEGPSITIAGNGATVGYMHLADNKFNAYQRTYVLQEFLVDRSFIFSEIGNKLPKKIKQEARTGNIPYIVMDMLTELKLSIPQNNSEQQKIGSFFKQLDDTIDLHQRKLDLLKEQKKGYLQKMFV